MAEFEHKFQLSRMDIEEAGSNPVKLAEEIHKQLNGSGSIGSVPIESIAKALDIIEIRAEPLDTFEGALITTQQRTVGKVLVNSLSAAPRRRFTIAHELCHFLNPWHRPLQNTDEESTFLCTKADMGGRSASKKHTRHARQEREANRFAIEMLAPSHLIKAQLEHSAELQHVLSVANQLNISKEAAARRFVELHEECVAIAFSRDDRLRYWVSNDGFPKTSISRDQPMPWLPQETDARKPTDLHEIDPSDWFATLSDGQAYIQTYYQQHGYAMSLLIVENHRDAEDHSVTDSVDWYSSFDRK